MGSEEGREGGMGTGSRAPAGGGGADEGASHEAERYVFEGEYLGDGGRRRGGEASSDGSSSTRMVTDGAEAAHEGFGGTGGARGASGTEGSGTWGVNGEGRAESGTDASSAGSDAGGRGTGGGAATDVAGATATLEKSNVVGPRSGWAPGGPRAD